MDGEAEQLPETQPEEQPPMEDAPEDPSPDGPEDPEGEEPPPPPEEEPEKGSPDPEPESQEADPEDPPPEEAPEDDAPADPAPDEEDPVPEDPAPEPEADDTEADADVEDNAENPEAEETGEIEEVPSPSSNTIFPHNGHNNIIDDDYAHMSTKANVADVDALRQAIADARSDASGVNRKAWVVVGHVDSNPNMVEVKGQNTSEEASLDEFRELLEDDQVMYALIRMTTTVDMSATVKFIYVHWVGEQVPFTKLGKYGVVHGSVEEYFNPYHFLLETGSRDELTEEELNKVMEEKSMVVNKVLEGPTDDKRQERGFTQHQIKKGTSSLLPKAVAPAGNLVEVAPELNEAIGEVRSDGSPLTWLIAGYEDNNLKKPLCLVDKGSGGVVEMNEVWENDRVMYGLLRTSDVYDDITTVKFVYIYWIGESVKPMMKGKVYANAGAVDQIFSPLHVALSFTNVEEITEEIVMEKVTSCSGSKSFVK